MVQYLSLMVLSGLIRRTAFQTGDHCVMRQETALPVGSEVSRTASALFPFAGKEQETPTQK